MTQRRGKASSRAVMKERAVKVYKHIIHGLMPLEIAKVESLGIDTVYYLIQEGGRILGGELVMVSKHGLLSEFVLGCRERRKHLWLQYGTTQDPLGTVKVGIMRQLLEEDHWLIDLAERMKLVEPKIVKVEHGGGIEVRHQFFTDIIRRSKHEDAIAAHHEPGGNGRPQIN